MQVEAFASGVGSDEDLAVAVFRELFGDLSAFFPAHSAVNCFDRIGLADEGSDPVDQIIEGVAVFGENDELPGPAVLVNREGLVLQDRAQLGPLAVDS